MLIVEVAMSGFPVEFLSLQCWVLHRFRGRGILQEWKLKRFGHDDFNRCIDLALVPTEVISVIINLISGRLIARSPLEDSRVIYEE